MIRFPKLWQFGTILIDPPWPTGKPRPKGSTFYTMVNRQYPTMKMVDLISLPVDDIRKPDSVILMWTTWGNVENAINLIGKWGFRYCTGMPWLKTVKLTGDERDYQANSARDRFIPKPIYGPGPWFQHCTELLLIGRRGKPFGSAGNPRPARKGIIISERLEHSRKPEDVHRWVESEQFPKPWIELFARRPRKGWTTWGNEVAEDNKMVIVGKAGK